MTPEGSIATGAQRVLLVACGALAHEIVALKTQHQWQHVDVQCLPAELHNRPEKIAPAVRAQIAAHRDRYERMYVVYADCGTGGALDRVLEEEGVERIAGAHCYEFYAGSAAFAQLHDEEPGSFYLTDFLLRHFDRLVIRALGLDRHPELRHAYFGHYTRLVYLAQLPATDETLAHARAAAKRLGLALEVRHTGYGELETALKGVSVRAEPALRQAQDDRRQAHPVRAEPALRQAQDDRRQAHPVRAEPVEALPLDQPLRQAQGEREMVDRAEPTGAGRH